MLLLWLILFFCFSSRPAHAQIPLMYQLLQAYRPTHQTTSITSTSLPAIALAKMGSPSPAGKVLGVSTIIPQNIGGDGRIITIAVLGDSMIDTLQTGIPQLQTALNQYFPEKKFNLLNYGYGGRDIEYGLYRLTNNYDYLSVHFDSLIAQKPDIVVIESFAYNNFGNSDEGINRHWLTMGAITTTLKQKLPTAKIVMAATIAPNSVIFSNGVKDLHFSALEKIEKTLTIKLYLQNTVNFATSQGFPLADAYHLSLFDHEGLNELINPTDNIHPSLGGATLFCDVIADTIYQNKLID